MRHARLEGKIIVGIKTKMRICLQKQVFRVLTRLTKIEARKKGKHPMSTPQIQMWSYKKKRINRTS